MSHSLKLTALSAVLFVLFFACSKDSAIKEELPSNDIYLVVPIGWTNPSNNFSSNPLSKDGFILGRKLFYETKLSSTNTISCGSCHQQFTGFADANKKLSTGINGAIGNRNTPPLFNLNWHNSFMWDGRVNNLEAQPISPITNPLEMGENMNNVIFKLQGSVEYRRLFKNAFGTETISKNLMLKALSQFMGMLVSSNSKYDKYLKGELTLDVNETNGLILFQQKCNSCHTAPLFTNFQFQNNGLDNVFSDAGRVIVTGIACDSGKFKTPSLRNIALSNPYMHDGRFNTLEEVLDHYQNGIKISSTVEPTLIGGISLTNQEKQDLISFLKTLTDETFINDKRFKNPFLN